MLYSKRWNFQAQVGFVLSTSTSCSNTRYMYSIFSSFTVNAITVNGKEINLHILSRLVVGANAWGLADRVEVVV